MGPLWSTRILGLEFRVSGLLFGGLGFWALGFDSVSGESVVLARDEKHPEVPAI